MHKFAIGLVAAGFLATPALAQVPLTFADVDTNGDGMLSYEELSVIWPDLTQEEFAAADTDSTGGLTPEQLDTLQPSAVPSPEATGADPMGAPAPLGADPLGVPEPMSTAPLEGDAVAPVESLVN